MINQRFKIFSLWALLNGIVYAWNLPYILAYHELFAYQRNIDDGSTDAKRRRGTELSPSETVELINDDLSYLRANGMGSVINTVYGANSLPYWNPSSTLLKDDNITTYLKWFNEMRFDLLAIDPVSKDDILHKSDTDIDNLIKYKLLGSELDLFLGLTPNNGDNLIASYRINDYHHLDTALTIAEKTRQRPVYDNNRKLAVLTPEFMHFLDEGAVISRKAGFDEHQVGSIGDNRFCHDYPVLDMGNKDVLLHKKREIWSTLEPDTVGALEIDFTRTPCMFSENLPAYKRGEIIREFLLFAIRATSSKHFNKKLILRFPSYVDWSKDFGFNIRSFLAVNHSSIDAVITGAGIGLRSRLPEADPFGLISMRNKIRDRGDSIKTKFYHQISYLEDAHNTTTNSGEEISYRRPISVKEVRGLSHLAKEIGYDGIYLFNFYYIFEMQRKLNFNRIKELSWYSLSRLFDTTYLDVADKNQGKAYFISSKTDNLYFDSYKRLTINKTLPVGNSFNDSSVLLRVKINEKANIVLGVAINDKCEINMKQEENLSPLHPLEHVYRNADSNTMNEIAFWTKSDYVYTAWVSKECLNNSVKENKFIFKSNISRFTNNESRLKLEFVEILEKNTIGVTERPSPIKISIPHIGTEYVNIKWDNGDTSVSRYGVYLNGKHVAYLSPENNSYTFSDLHANTTYSYTVRAFNSIGTTFKKGEFRTPKEDFTWLIAIYGTILQ